jgi:hypothetical protein
MGMSSLRARLSLGAALLGTLGPAAVYALFSYLRFGNPLSTGYDHLPIVLWQPLQLEAVRSLLLGLGKGLFIFSPLLIIALWGMWIERARLALYSIACLAALAGNVILSASFWAPDGCWSWGTRYQVHLLPLFAYPAWVGMRDLLGRRIGAPVVAIALGLGLFFQLCGLLAPFWREYVQVYDQLRKSVPIADSSADSWWAPDDSVELEQSCWLVYERQFAMRLGNIASSIRAVGEGKESTFRMLRTFANLFANFWGLRMALDNSGWARMVVICTWLGIVVGAATCLYGAFYKGRDCQIH